MARALAPQMFPHTAGGGGHGGGRAATAGAGRQHVAHGAGWLAAARGGALQRYRASASSSRISDGENAASSNSAPPDAPFNRELKIQWARNQITSAQVQKLAMAALEQGLADPKALHALAPVGTTLAISIVL